MCQFPTDFGEQDVEMQDVSATGRKTRPSRMVRPAVRTPRTMTAVSQSPTKAAGAQRWPEDSVSERSCTAFFS